MELWKDIEGYEGYYQVSNTGKVKSLERQIQSIHRWGVPSVRTYPEKILLLGDVKGYNSITLRKNNKSSTKRVNRLVAKAFISNPNNLPEVNHKDGNKKNDNMDNLEWCTKSYNMKHAYEIGLQEPTRGSKSGMAKLTENDVILIRFLFTEGHLGKEIAKMFHISLSTAYQINCGERWAHI